MNTQNIIQNSLSEAAGRPVQFYAYYWGKFELIDITEAKGHFIFAKATSAALHRSLSFKEDRIFLHMDNEEPMFLTKDLQRFLSKATDFAQQRIYDARPRYTDIFTPAQMYVSRFRDPEDFEEVEAYLEIIQGIDAHFHDLLGIIKIKGEEINEAKKIDIQLKNSTHIITLIKELFDIEILNSLNKIIAAHSLYKETLHLSIDPNMNMVILKLDKKSLEEASRMGLIV